MKKSDLKTGMRVYYNNCDGCYSGVRIVIITENKPIIISKVGMHGNLNSYNDNMKHKEYKTLNIDRVYSVPKYENEILNFSYSCDLLWERKEEKSIVELDGIEYSESTLRSIIKKATDK